jgi:hypothetical protein
VLGSRWCGVLRLDGSHGNVTLQSGNASGTGVRMTTHVEDVTPAPPGPTQ